MKKLLTIGDSHAGTWEGWDKIKIEGLEIKMRSVPSELMYSWARDKTDNSLLCKNSHFVCFCHGEIDMRNHIFKYEPSWQNNINSLIEMYITNIKHNTRECDDITIIIHNIVPHLYTDPPLPGVPRIGQPEDVKKYTLYANKKLEEKCAENGWTFMDTYEKYCNQQGFLDPQYSDDICHISNPIYNQEWLEDFLKDKL